MFSHDARRVLAGCVTVTLALCADAGAYASSFTVLYAAPAGKSSFSVSQVRGLDIYGVDAKGSRNYGALYKLSGTATYAELYAFRGGSDGRSPNNRLYLDSKANIFGTTSRGGDTSLSGGAGGGTVFKLSNANQLTTLHVFETEPEGVVPLDGLKSASGPFYGTTSRGALSPGNGTVFSVDASGTFNIVYSFKSSPQDGHCPFTGVQRDASGALYGTTVGMGYGGLPGGSVWTLASGASAPTTLYAFTDGVDGEWPTATPTVTTNGKVYGVSSTRSGSAYAGAVWSIVNGSFTILHALNGTSDGYAPNGPLFFAPSGLLYGTTASGGLGYGTVFWVSETGSFKVVHQFTAAEGGAPNGGLAFDASGHLYGGTSGGTIYEIAP